jgi:hypothetical protein
MNYDIDNKKYNINELKNIQSIFPTRMFKILIILILRCVDFVIPALVVAYVVKTVQN